MDTMTSLQQKKNKKKQKENVPFQKARRDGYDDFF